VDARYSDEPVKRLFFGLEVLGNAREAAEAVLLRLTENVVHQGTRWVRPEKLHLTLVFLGHVADEKLEAVEGVGRTVAEAAGPVSLAVTELGGFPHLGRPKVVWIRVEESPALRELQSALVARLASLVTLEDREYHPHVTLGRVSPGSPKVGAKVRALAEELGPVTAEWTTADLILFETTADGRYEVLGRYPLTGTADTPVGDRNTR
jgi:2'-5' RNA ligase